MKKRKQIIILCSTVTLLVSIIFNIILLCSTVYHGKYSYTNNNGLTISFTFSHNTYIYEETSDERYFWDFGFYKTIPPGSSNGYVTVSGDKDALFFEPIGDSFNRTAERNNVFSFSIYTIGNEWDTEKEFICVEAVIIQIILSCLILVSIIAMIISIKQPLSDSNIQNKIHKSMADSLDKIQFDKNQKLQAELDELKKDDYTSSFFWQL